MNPPFILKRSALEKIMDGTIDLDTDTFYAALFEGSHTPAEADDTWSDLTGENADGDYAQQALAGQAIITVDTKFRAWDTNDIDFGADVTISAKYLYLMKGTAGAAAAGDLIVGWADLNPTMGVDAITSLTKANPVVVTSAAHGLINGDLVLIYNSNVPELNGRHFTVANAATNTFELSGIDGSAYRAAGTIGSWLKINNTDEQTSNPMFQVNAPSNGWFRIG